jgi:hypothetical protein
MLQVMSEYPIGRTGLGDQIAAELAQNPNSPRNRAKRAAEEARLRGESAATVQPNILKSSERPQGPAILSPAYSAS